MKAFLSLNWIEVFVLSSIPLSDSFKLLFHCSNIVSLVVFYRLFQANNSLDFHDCMSLLFFRTRSIGLSSATITSCSSKNQPIYDIVFAVEILDQKNRAHSNSYLLRSQ